MAVWQVEIDGKVFELEGKTPPSEQEARQAVGQFSKSKGLLQSLQKPAVKTVQGMQQLANYLPGTSQIMQAERIQAPQRETIKEALYNKMGGKFPVARGLTAGALDLTAPSNIVAAGVAPYIGGKGLGMAARNPASRRFLARQTPTLSKSLLRQNPVKPQYKDIKGQQVDVTQPLPTGGNVFQVDYITKTLYPRVQKIVKSNIEKITPGIERFAKEKLKISQSAIDTIKRKGARAIQETETKLGNTDNISQRIRQGLESKRLQADNLYRTVVDKFTGTIDASPFRIKLGQILRQKGWVDQTGKPTNRFGAKLDPVLDDLTRLHQDLRTVYKGKNIKGFRVPKEDFTTYRDLLGRLLKDRPSDVSIMQLREALYQSAERSGMKGIIQARNLERVANQVEGKLVKKGLVGEKGLGNFHNMTQEQLRALKEIEFYIKEPFIDDLANLTAAKDLTKITSIIDDVPGQGNPLVNQLVKATDPKNFNYIKNNLRPFLGEATESIFKDLGAHRFATGIKTAGKWGGGIVGGALAASLLRKPVLSAIEGISSGGGGSTQGGGY